MPRRVLADRRRGSPPVVGGDNGRRVARATAARRRRVQRLVDPAAGRHPHGVGRLDGPTTRSTRRSPSASLRRSSPSILALTDRPRRRPAPTERVSVAGRSRQSDGLRRSVVAAVTWVVLAGLFVEPGWAWWGLAGGAAVVATRRIRLAGLVAVAAIGWIAVDVVDDRAPGQSAGDAGLPPAVRRPPQPRPVRRRRRRRQRPRPPSRLISNLRSPRRRAGRRTRPSAGRGRATR